MPKLKGAGMAVEGRQADDAELSAATRAPALAPVQPIVVWLYLAQSLPISFYSCVSRGRLVFRPATAWEKHSTSQGGGFASQRSPDCPDWLSLSSFYWWPGEAHTLQGSSIISVTFVLFLVFWPLSSPNTTHQVSEQIAKTRQLTLMSTDLYLASNSSPLSSFSPSSSTFGQHFLISWGVHSRFQ